MNLKRTHNKYRNLHLRSKLTLVFCSGNNRNMGTYKDRREFTKGRLSQPAFYTWELLSITHTHTHTHTHTNAHTHTLVFFLGPTETTFGMHCSFHFALTF
jgi:hypothetical protein